MDFNPWLQTAFIIGVSELAEVLGTSSSLMFKDAQFSTPGLHHVWSRPFSEK